MVQLPTHRVTRVADLQKRAAEAENETPKTLEAIKYTRGKLDILNQLRLPHAEVYDPCRGAEDAWHAIHDMRTRGAPAIAIVAALSLAVELANQSTESSASADDVKKLVKDKLDYLVTSRPTAVNLADAAAKLKQVVETAATTNDADGVYVREAYIHAAEQILVDDVSDNQAIGHFGAEWIVKNAGVAQEKISVLTHCNTGSLATAGYGTALGVVRSLKANGNLERAFCTETRPYNQGSRLTAFELVHDKIPATLITDSMAGFLMRKGRKGGPQEQIAAVVVGADRVAANGDTANKIGTYSLAILARHHGVKFLVAAPRTTIDRATKSGADITIEERKGEEMTSIKGPRWDGSEFDLESVEQVSIAAFGINTWNPAFDVTPAELIDGVITEVGVVTKGEDGAFNFDEAFQRPKSEVKPSSIGGL
ncbi:S-methyl-5-thioribose-1-phosphate isomerase [Taxawa tesnikishii (nom. ined.)]|nr:S-methyl-5-thioribose-1-phosphate isomerase [Dothideales sp. JES 119]